MLSRSKKLSQRPFRQRYSSQRKQVKLTDFLQKGQEEASHIVHESTSGGSKDEKLDFPKKRKTEENERDEETGAQKARKDQMSSADTHLVATRGRPTCEQPEVNVNDIGLYVFKIESMTDEEKFDLIQNVWKSLKEFVFPETIVSIDRKR